MNFDLRELYQEVILDHNKRPRNKGRLDPRSHHSEGYNPLCGDMIVIDIQAPNGVIEGISFDGKGCAISTASASIMTEVVKGKSLVEAEELFDKVQAMLTGSSDEEFEDELAALSGVKEFPVRIKCAALPWHALHSAIKQVEKVSTEDQ